MIGGIPLGDSPEGLVNTLVYNVWNETQSYSEEKENL